ncbi:MAG: HD domain-containing protein [Candidatus Latescibacteria bacterium]|nr:HD domain-containing protein [bacterium]MBD3422909.1 HD domain-containing protein [Candidatus Latescibacterota bacterium]
MLGILQVGDNVDEVMVVSKLVAREFSGGEFLLFQFSNRDGILKGVMWDPPEGLKEKIEEGDVARIKGKVQDYKGTLQLKVFEIDKLDKSDYDPGMFLPSSGRDLQGIYSYILDLISGIENPHIRKLLEAIFRDDSFRERFLTSPAAKSWHHSYIGGLAEHVHDMLRTAERAAEVYPEADRDLLLAGVIIHDLGKMQELGAAGYIDYTDRGRLLGHISLGLEFINEYIRGIDDFPDELAMKLKHMMLSHHGRLEHGSPVLPMTIESLLLSYIDDMDAQVRGALQFINKPNGKGGNWTEYVRFLDRFLYSDRQEDVD